MDTPSHFAGRSNDTGLHTITYMGADGGRHLACLPPDGQGGLTRLPDRLRPSYHGYGWTDRRKRDDALAFLLGAR